MPFYLGTAAIAEILLYALWEKYTNSSIEIDSNIMLDVEALTLPFNFFYDNCFNRTILNYNTPYLIIHIQNNTENSKKNLITHNNKINKRLSSDIMKQEKPKKSKKSKKSKRKQNEISISDTIKIKKSKRKQNINK